jgi:phosphate:Na+ symporter
MKIRLLFKLVNDLESIGDVCKSISKTLKRKKKKKIWFPQDLRNNVNELFVLLEKSLKHGLVYLKTEQSTGMSEAHELRHQIVKTRKRFLKEHLDNIEKGMYTYQAGVIYTDILNHCSMMSDNIINVTEAIHDYNA